MSKKRWGTLTVSITLAVVWLVLLRPLFLGGPASYIVVSGVEICFAMSNMETCFLPPNTAFSLSSALIMRLFLLSCSLFFLI